MLNAVGLDWPNVAHVNSYRTPEPDGAIPAATTEMARQFRRRVPDHQPIWTRLGVAALGDPKMRVEIRVTAFRDDWGRKPIRVTGLSRRNAHSIHGLLEIMGDRA